jgi:3-dehydroquinate synthase
VVAITDPNVMALYGDTIRTHSDRQIVIGTGEGNKTLDTVGDIYRQLIEMGADRRTYIVGFGGGIVTDIAGFAASTFMRGLDFGFVATSLLAQVDASVGGKNGVNVGGFKNMAGVFSQPDFVLCDTGVLRTLPPREFRAGLAEMIKAGIVADPELFALLESHSPDELLATHELLTQVVVAAIRVKAAIVEADEREGGVRRKLNLGHTVGHAVEKLTREFNHGEAVAIGLVAIADASVRLGVLAAADRDRILRVVERAGLPVSTSGMASGRVSGEVSGSASVSASEAVVGPVLGLSAGDISEAITRDKKVEGDGLWLVVIRQIGEVEVRRMSFADLAELLN